MPDLGIGEFLAGSLLADAVGTTAATGLVDAGIGAGVGALSGAVTGGNVGMDALGGAIGGGALGIAPGISEALDIPPALGGAAIGAAGGAAGSAVSGTNPLVGAALGGAAGGIGGLSSSTPGSTPGSVSGASTTGGVAAAPAAPAGVSGGGDVTLPTDTSSFPGAAGPQSANFGAPDTSGLNTGVNSALGDTASLNSPAIASGTPSSAPAPGALGTSGGGGNNIAGTPSSGNISGASGGGTGGGASGAGVNPVSGQAGNAPSAFSNAISDPSMSNIGTALSKNAGLLTATAGLGNDVMSALSGPPKGTNALQTEASQLESLGAQNANYLNTGTLPAGVQSGINQATQSAIAAIKSKYAAMGMSGSSAEQSDIASVQTNAQVQGANIAMSLLQQGVNETGLSSQIYGELIKNTMASDTNFASAFTNLASAVGGGSGTGQSLTIKTG